MKWNRPDVTIWSVFQNSVTYTHACKHTHTDTHRHTHKHTCTQHTYISLSMLVCDSRDQHANVWLPKNAAMLTAFTILFAAKSSSKTRLVQYVITAKNLFKTGINTLETICYQIFKKPHHNIFVWRPYNLIALQPYGLM